MERSSRSTLALAALALGLTSASRASAAPPPADAAPVHVDLGAGTYFPVDVAAEGTLELPYRILVQASVGWMPAPYSNTIVDFMNGIGALSSTESELLELAIQNSFVGRLSAGWRPFERLGLEALVGYELVTIGGGVSGADVVEAYLISKGVNDPMPAGGSGNDVPLRATLHDVQATVAWRFLLWRDRIVLRASLSYLQCFASSTGASLAATRPIGQAAADRINTDLEGYLNPIFTEYVKIPVAGLTAAYRF